MPLSDSDPELAHPEAAGWVLGVLDAADADRFAGHLRSCPDCRAAVAELGPAARLLQTAAPAGVPSAALQARTLASVAQAAKAAGRSDRHSRWRRWNVRMVALAAAAVIAAGTGAGLELSRSSSGAAEVYSITLHPAVSGLVASGQVVATQTGNGWSVELTAAHLADLGPGKFYECWWLGPDNRPGHPDLIEAGTFTVGPSGSATLPLASAANPDDFPGIEITTGSPRSTLPGQTVMVGVASDSD
jgi:anti-sigma-K factor RskA